MVSNRCSEASLSALTGGVAAAASVVLLFGASEVLGRAFPSTRSHFILVEGEPYHATPRGFDELQQAAMGLAVLLAAVAAKQASLALDRPRSLHVGLGLFVVVNAVDVVLSAGWHAFKAPPFAVVMSFWLLVLFVFSLAEPASVPSQGPSLTRVFVWSTLLFAWTWGLTEVCAPVVVLHQQVTTSQHSCPVGAVRLGNNRIWARPDRSRSAIHGRRAGCRLHGHGGGMAVLAP